MEGTGGGGARERPASPERNASETQEFRSEIKIAGGLQFKMFASDVFPLCGDNHVGDGAGGVVRENRQASNGGDVLYNGERLEPSGAGASAAKVGGVKFTEAIFSGKYSKLLE